MSVKKKLEYLFNRRFSWFCDWSREQLKRPHALLGSVLFSRGTHAGEIGMSAYLRYWGINSYYGTIVFFWGGGGYNFYPSKN